MMFKRYVPLVGDRVSLKKGRYTESRFNPLETIGIVVDPSPNTDEEYCVTVEWGGVYDNEYTAEDLYPANCVLPIELLKGF